MNANSLVSDLCRRTENESFYGKEYLFPTMSRQTIDTFTSIWKNLKRLATLRLKENKVKLN